MTTIAACGNMPIKVVKMKEETKQNLKRAKNIVEDIAALLIAVGTDLIFNLVFFSYASVDDLTRYGFSAIVFLMVFYKVRALKKRVFILWAMFAAVTLFCGVSLSLFDIDYQEGMKKEKRELIANAEKDAEFIRLTESVAEKKALELGWQDQYRAASRRETMDQISGFLQSSITDRQKAETERSEYYAKITTPAKAEITVRDVFYAIPKAIQKGDYVMVVIFSLMFGGVEIAIVAAVMKIEGRPGRRGGTARKVWNWLTGKNRPNQEPENQPEACENGQGEAPEPEAADTMPEAPDASPAPEPEATEEKSGSPEKRPRGPYLTYKVSSEPATMRDMVALWIRISWFPRRTGRSERIASRDAFMNFCAAKKIEFMTNDIYDRIKSSALIGECIDEAGHVIELNEEFATEKILRILGEK